LTNNKDYLSQEEIDALLKHSEEEVQSEGELITEMEMDALGEIGNISLGTAATALSTLLGQKVEITTPTVSFVERGELDKEFPQPHVAVHVDYVDGIEGTNLLVIKTYDAQVIADLMMGGSGQPLNEELSEFHVSAVQEAMNQMMGSAATSMSTIFNRFVNIGPPGINILDFNNPSQSRVPVDGPLLKISFRLKIGDLIDSNMMQLIPLSFGKHLVSMLMGATDSSSQSVSTATSMDQGIPSSPTPMTHVPELSHKPEMFNSSAPTPSFSENMTQPTPAPATPPQRNVQIQPVQFTPLEPSGAVSQEQTNLNLLLDIPLKVTVELGRTTKIIREILELSQGSIIELDKLAGEPVDILVNSKLIAKGEVVVIEENFGVRVTDIISQWDRVRKLQ
jgi:flagellar motor switch protein FliN/FliY